MSETPYVQSRLGPNGLCNFPVHQVGFFMRGRIKWPYIKSFFHARYNNVIWLKLPYIKSFSSMSLIKSYFKRGRIMWTGLNDSKNVFLKNEITLRKSDHFRMHVIYMCTMLFDVDVLGRVKTPTRYVCETHKSPIMANSKYGQDHKDKYLDTSSLDASHGIVVCQSSLDIQFSLRDRL